MSPPAGLLPISFKNKTENITPIIRIANVKSFFFRFFIMKKKQNRPCLFILQDVASKNHHKERSVNKKGHPSYHGWPSFSR